MTRQLASVLLGFAVCATAAAANDGSYGSAEAVEITRPVAGGPDGAREGFWLISLGGGDAADGYRIEPPPQAGDRVSIVGATEDGRRIPATLELVRRFGGQAAARASLLEGDPFAGWTADAPVYLRVAIEPGSAPVELLVGVRITPAGPAAAPEAAAGKMRPETAKAPALVVPAD